MTPHVQDNNGSPAAAYWAEVRERQAELKEQFKDFTFTYITSIENRRKQMVGGRVFEADFRNAAMRLADGTHRVSTPEEIERYRADRSNRAASLQEIEEKRKNTMTIKPSREENERLAGVVAAAVQAVVSQNDAKKK